MARKILVFGAGLVARPLVSYFLERAAYSVVVADVDLERARKLVSGHARGEAKRIAADEAGAVAAEIRQADLVVSLLPSPLHPAVAAVAVEAGKSFVTASYVSPAMRDLDQRAREKGIVLLNELGLDPGIDHMEAMRIIRGVHEEGGRVLSFISYCGGLPAPEANTNPFGYKFSWSPRGVLLASKSAAKFIKDGKIVVIPAEKLFESPEAVRISGLGLFEGYPNRDSASYLETYGIPEAQTILRGTLRYPGWCRTLKKMGDLGLLEEKGIGDWRGRTYRDFMTFVVQAPPGTDLKTFVSERLGLDPSSDIIDRLEWLGLFADEPLPIRSGSPLDILAARMIERLEYREGERDMVVLQHDFLAETPGRGKERITSTLVDYGIPGGDSSMSRTVGLPAAIGARLVLEGRVRETGVRIPVTPDIYNPVLDELAGLGIRFVEERRALQPVPRV
jgi:saccharopine dehydrogenase (NADP+, L-glutamate forming)